MYLGCPRGSVAAGCEPPGPWGFGYGGSIRAPSAIRPGFHSLPVLPAGFLLSPVPREQHVRVQAWLRGLQV